MHDYSELDDAIVAEIKGGRNSFAALRGALSTAAQAFAQNPRAPRACPSPPWRVIDRRLQALRKRKVIAFDRPHGLWSAK